MVVLQRFVRGLSANLVIMCWSSKNKALILKPGAHIVVLHCFMKICDWSRWKLTCNHKKSDRETHGANANTQGADGGFTKPHILRLAVDEIEATHVLILTNQDQTVSTIPFLERFLNHTLFRWRMPPALRFAAHERRKERMKVLEDMEAQYPKPYALVWGNHSILSMERDPKKVKAVVEASRAWWMELLAD